mmetsp:Transcript_16696/g.25111  ORF Transcript_16696/g.25111 Transcript_16696/m.25111 type:complete len:784 (-) Transcript_16696:234-2585(-)
MSDPPSPTLSWADDDQTSSAGVVPATRKRNISDAPLAPVRSRPAGSVPMYTSQQATPTRVTKAYSEAYIPRPPVGWRNSLSNLMGDSSPLNQKATLDRPSTGYNWAPVSRSPSNSSQPQGNLNAGRVRTGTYGGTYGGMHGNMYGSTHGGTFGGTYGPHSTGYGGLSKSTTSISRKSAGYGTGGEDLKRIKDRLATLKTRVSNSRGNSPTSRGSSLRLSESQPLTAMQPAGSPESLPMSSSTNIKKKSPKSSSRVSSSKSKSKKSSPKRSSPKKSTPIKGPIKKKSSKSSTNEKKLQKSPQPAKRRGSKTKGKRKKNLVESHFRKKERESRSSLSGNERPRKSKGKSKGKSRKPRESKKKNRVPASEFAKAIESESSIDSQPLISSKSDLASQSRIDNSQTYVAAGSPTRLKSKKPEKETGRSWKPVQTHNEPVGAIVASVDVHEEDNTARKIERKAPVEPEEPAGSRKISRTKHVKADEDLQLQSASTDSIFNSQVLKSAKSDDSVFKSVNEKLAIAALQHANTNPADGKKPIGQYYPEPMVTSPPPKDAEGETTHSTSLLESSSSPQLAKIGIRVRSVKKDEEKVKEHLKHVEKQNPENSKDSLMDSENASNKGQLKIETHKDATDAFYEDYQRQSFANMDVASSLANVQNYFKADEIHALEDHQHLPDMDLDSKKIKDIQIIQFVASGHSRSVSRAPMHSYRKSQPEVPKIVSTVAISASSGPNTYISGLGKTTSGISLQPTNATSLNASEHNGQKTQYETKSLSATQRQQAPSGCCVIS